MHCNEHFGQEGDKLGVSSTKSVVDILPQRTSSRENTFFCVVDRWNSIFFTRYWSYFPLFMSGGCCNWFSRLLKISLSKKINQKIMHFVSHYFLRFCYFCCPQLWRWWSQIKQVISATWRPTTPCCLFPHTKIVKLFLFKGNKSWCSSWDRKTARATSK